MKKEFEKVYQNQFRHLGLREKFELLEGLINMIIAIVDEDEEEGQEHDVMDFAGACPSPEEEDVQLLIDKMRSPWA